MSIKTVRDTIGALIEGLESSLTFAETYYEMPTDVVTTPAVAILTIGGSEIHKGTKSDDLICNFAIRAMVEKTDSSDQDKTQTDKLLTLVDGILNTLRLKTNRPLSDNAHWFDFSELGGVKVGDLGNQSVFYFDIICETKSLKSTV